MAALETAAAQLDEDVERAQHTLEGFEEVRNQLLHEIQEEADRILAHEEPLATYNSVIGDLRTYRVSLPVVLVEDLGEQALEIYNLINEHDPPFDLLDDLVLPKLAGEDLRVRFSDGSGKHVNALQVLSDGHLRCLGVAILLAKNLHEGCGLIIFDDVVNAVDDDHRAGLADVLMDHPAISARQIVITTHGREFIKVLSHRVSKKEFEDRVRQIDFLVPTVSRGVIIDRHAVPRHYLVRSAQHIEKGLFREALGDHRRALEAICEKLWKRLSGKYNVLLPVRIRALKATPDLRSVVDSLMSFLRKTVSSTSGDLADSIASEFGIIVDRWEELNKGTHEEEEQKEFDPTIAREIQAALESLDNSVKTRWREL